MSGLSAASPPATMPHSWASAWSWARTNLFASPAGAIVSIAMFAAIASGLVAAVDWAILNANWAATGAEPCRRAIGACWAVIPEKYRVMLFGFYAYDEHWRPALAIIVFVAAAGITGIPRFWRWQITVPLWISVAITIFLLLRGGVLGLTHQETALWGGLPLTLIIFSAQLALGLPLGVLLALGRRSSLPAISIGCVILIEGVRAVPPIALLFFAAIVSPLFLPPGTDMDKLLRVIVAMVILQACLQAEVVRGGLQAVPDGQTEAASALGLGHWATLWTVILPQALRTVIPGLTNQIIQAFKNSTLVIIVGMFDFLNTTTAAISDPKWIRFFVEAYVFAAVVYFCGCWLISAYGRFLEEYFKLVRN